MAFGDVAQFVSSAARTTSGNSGQVVVEKGLQTNILVDVTAASGTTPTLDLAVEWSADGTNFGAAEPVDSFTQITATKRVSKQFTSKMPFFRLVWTIAGTTPSFTFLAFKYETE